jgi:CDP-glucose 4,6-dehydratase
VEDLVVMTPARRAFWRDRPTLVTGGTGLVGSWLVERLVEAGAEVVCLVRDWVPQSELVRGGWLQRVRVVRGDVTDATLVARVLGEYEVDTVIHLAAQTIVGVANRDPVSTLETNVRGTWVMLEACRHAPRVRQVVLASSDKAYGEVGQLPYDETMPLLGRHPYDVSKSCADLIAQAYATTYGLPVVITRCGNFYGGGDLNWNRLVPGTIRSLLRGQPPVIRSDGTLVRDYFYVEDGALAYMALAEALAQDRSLAGEAFNFSSEEPLSARALVDRLIALVGIAVEPVVLNEATHEIQAQHLSSRKARAVLGWQPAFSLDTGLAQTVAWYRAFLASQAG